MLTPEQRATTAKKLIDRLMNERYFGFVMLTFEAGTVTRLKLEPNLRIDDLAVELGVIPVPNGKNAHQFSTSVAIGGTQREPTRD